MPYSIEAWSSQQWGVFVTVLAAGLLAALLLPIVVRIRRDWPITHGAGVHRPNTPKPPYRAAATRDDRRWERRRRRAIADATGPLTAVVDPTEQLLVQAWHVDATSETVGVIAAVEPLVDPVVRDWFAAEFTALDTFRIGMEPVMRTARLWTLQAGETYAENALRAWHIEEITGEISNPFTRVVLDASSTTA